MGGPPRAVRVSGWLWCALAAAAWGWAGVHLIRGSGSGLSAGNEQLLMALLVLGGPPLLAPLLFRRGDGRVLVPVCGALAAGLGFVVRAEVLDGQVGHAGAELVVLAYAVPYASVVAVVALVCSLTRDASGYFRYGPEACGPDCYGPQCYAGHLAPSTGPGRRPRT